MRIEIRLLDDSGGLEEKMEASNFQDAEGKLAIMGRHYVKRIMDKKLEEHHKSEKWDAVSPSGSY